MATRIKVSTPNDIERAEFLRWMDLLYTAAGDNIASPCRLLNIAPQTWYRWREDPPIDWWYREVFRVCIEAYIHQMRRMITATNSQWRTKVWSDRCHVIETRLHELPSERYFTAQLNSIYSPKFNTAVKLLRRLCRPGKKISFSEVILPELRERGISLRMAGNAADTLGIEKGKTGYQGKAWWRRAPDELDDED